MRAVISGQAGVAVVETDETNLLYSIDDADQPRSVRHTDAALILEDATDAFFVQVNKADEVVPMLAAAWERDRLLQMLLILLRGDARTNIRKEAAAAAEELADNEEARRFALNRLYAHPLTSDADPKGAARIARLWRHVATATIFDDLIEHQNAITEIAPVWERIASELSPIVRSQLRRALEDTDVFRGLATARSVKECRALAKAAARHLRGIAQAAEVLGDLADARREWPKRQEQPPRVFISHAADERTEWHPAVIEGTADFAETLFLQTVPLIDRVAAFVCRRNHLDPEETREFAADVKLKLIANDYEIIRKFEGTSEFRTYLTTVITRHFYRYRVDRWGKWRPSSEAKRLGEKGITIERLLTRDGYSLHEVQEILTTPAGSPYTRAEIEQIYLRLPDRRPRLVLVAEQTSPDAASDPTENLEPAEREKVARHAAQVIDDVMKNLSPKDQVILRLRFWQAKRVPDIAEMLHLDQKKVYKRIDKLLATLRSALERGGLSQQDVETLLSKGDQELELQFSERDRTEDTVAAEDHDDTDISTKLPGA